MPERSAASAPELASVIVCEGTSNARTATEEARFSRAGLCSVTAPLSSSVSRTPIGKSCVSAICAFGSAAQTRGFALSLSTEVSVEITANAGATSAPKPSPVASGLPWLPTLSTSLRSVTPESISACSSANCMSPVNRNVFPRYEKRSTRELSLSSASLRESGPSTVNETPSATGTTSPASSSLCGRRSFSARLTILPTPFLSASEKNGE